MVTKAAESQQERNIHLHKFNDSCRETSLRPQFTVCIIAIQFVIALGCSYFLKPRKQQESLLRPLLAPAMNSNPFSLQLYHWDQLREL